MTKLEAIGLAIFELAEMMKVPALTLLAFAVGEVLAWCVS